MRYFLLLSCLALLLAGSVAEAANEVALLPHVVNNVALKAVKSTAYKTIVRDGFTTAGDGGAAVYNSSNLACTLNGGNGDDGIEVNPDSGGGCWLGSFPSSGLDIRQFGASGSGQTTTAGTTSGSARITLASAADFKDGQGVVVVGASTAPTPGVPTAFTVASACTPVVVSGNLVSGSPIINLVQGVGILVGDTIAGTGIPGGTTVAAYIPGSQQLRMSANATAPNNGVALTITDPCNVTYAYRIASYDDAGGITAPLAAQTTVVGPKNPSTINQNCLDWTRPANTTGLTGYIVWRSVGGGAYSFFQTANAEGAGACLAATNGPLWDGGQPPSDRPFWIPDDPATIPGGGQPRWLRTTISSGGGTTSLVLASNSSQTISSPTDPSIGMVLHDDTTAYKHWLSALNSLSGTGIISANLTAGAGQAVYRFNDSTQITSSNVKILGDPGALLKPFGSPASGYPISFAGADGAVINTVNGNLEEGQNCLPLTGPSGLNPGRYLRIQQPSPGGASQTGTYSLISPISAMACPDGVTTGVRLKDSAGITFTDAAHTETATITGAVAATDTVTLTVSGDFVCNATYTVVGGDTLTTVARGLALAVNNSGCGAVASNSLGVVTAQWPNTTSLAWARSTTHGGGGTEAIALAAGTAFIVQEIVPITGIVVDGVNMDGSDMTGTVFGGGFVGVKADKTAKSRFLNLTLNNFTNNELAFLGRYGYDNTYENISISRGSGGTPNITSYADFWLRDETNPSVKNIATDDALSFGPQLFGVQGAAVNNLRFNQAYFGRGFKLGSVLRSSFSDIKAANAVFKNLAICCASYRNQFSNIDLSYSYGENPDGLGTFDDWSRLNHFTNFRSINSVFDLDIEITDTLFTFVNVDIGGGAFGHGPGGFPTSYVLNQSALFTNINGCEVAFSSTVSNGLTCQRDSGTWTPALAGTTTPGTTGYAVQQGTWERNDRNMSVRFRLITNAALVGYVGNMVITGLPVAASSAGNGSCAIEAWKGATLNAGYTMLTMGINTSSSQISIFENGSGMGYANVLVGAFANPVELIGACNYPVN